MDSLKVTDAQSAAVQKTPNRVALDDIEAQIACEFSVIAGSVARTIAETGMVKFADDFEVPKAIDALDLLTIHVIVMRNGFTIIGKTAPADAGNFNAEIGRKFAREDAIRQIWPLMGFALRDRLSVRDKLGDGFMTDAETYTRHRQSEKEIDALARDVEAAERKTGIADLPPDQQKQLDDGKPVDPKPDPGSQPPAAPAPAADPAKVQVLVGSDAFDSQIFIGGKLVQLGEIVTAAFDRLGVSENVWNEQLTQALRDMAIEGEIKRRREEVAGAAGDAPPEKNAGRPADASDPPRGGNTTETAAVTNGPGGAEQSV